MQARSPGIRRVPSALGARSSNQLEFTAGIRALSEAAKAVQRTLAVEPHVSGKGKKTLTSVTSLLARCKILPIPRVAKSRVTAPALND